MGAATQVFNAPFTSPQAYTLSSLTADGASHTVSAVFSAASSCTNTMAYTAPVSCAVVPVCSVSLTATPSACTAATNTYNVAGNLTFANAPSTGTLTVSMGAITQVFNAPFTSPQAYTLTGLTADGASHTVTAVFSAASSCTNTMAYTAPASCAVVCTTPTFKAYGVRATCSNGLPNNNAQILINTIANGTKFGYSAGTSYTGPAFATATTISGTTATISSLPSTASKYTVRVFNGANDCFKDIVVIIPGINCNTNCTIDAGPDQMICAPATTVDLKDAAATEEWIVDTNNPSPATINATTGVVSGMTGNGVYSFILRDKVTSTCFDVVFVFRSVTELPALTSCEATYQLPTSPGVTWSVVSGTASVLASGLITGMSTDGTYRFSSSFNGCTSAVDVVKTTCIAITPPCPSPNCGTVTVIKN